MTNIAEKTAEETVEKAPKQAAPGDTRVEPSRRPDPDAARWSHCAATLASGGSRSSWRPRPSHGSSPAR